MPLGPLPLLFGTTSEVLLTRGRFVPRASASEDSAPSAGAVVAGALDAEKSADDVDGWAVLGGRLALPTPSPLLWTAPLDSSNRCGCAEIVFRLLLGPGAGPGPGVEDAGSIPVEVAGVEVLMAFVLRKEELSSDSRNSLCGERGQPSCRESQHLREATRQRNSAQTRLSTTIAYL